MLLVLLFRLFLSRVGENGEGGVDVRTSLRGEESPDARSVDGLPNVASDRSYVRPPSPTLSGEVSSIAGPTESSREEMSVNDTKKGSSRAIVLIHSVELGWRGGQEGLTRGWSDSPCRQTSRKTSSRTLVLTPGGGSVRSRQTNKKLKFHAPAPNNQSSHCTCTADHWPVLLARHSIIGSFGVSRDTSKVWRGITPSQDSRVDSSVLKCRGHCSTEGTLVTSEAEILTGGVGTGRWESSPTCWTTGSGLTTATARWVVNPTCAGELVAACDRKQWVWQGGAKVERLIR